MKALKLKLPEIIAENERLKATLHALTVKKNTASSEGILSSGTNYVAYSDTRFWGACFCILKSDFTVLYASPEFCTKSGNVACTVVNRPYWELVYNQPGTVEV